MADSTLTNLAAAGTLDGTELYYAVQGGSDRKVTGLQIRSASPLNQIDAARFGVQYNGSDESALLQNAINTVQQSGGGTVEITGVVSVQSTIILKAGVRLLGRITPGYYEGRDRTFLTNISPNGLTDLPSASGIRALAGFTTPITGVIQMDPSTVINNGLGVRVRAMTLQNLIIDANHIANYAVLASYSTLWERQMVIQDCYLTGALSDGTGVTGTGHGLRTQSMLGVKLINSLFGGNDSYGASLEQSADSFIYYCDFKSNGVAAVPPPGGVGGCHLFESTTQISGGRFEENTGHGPGLFVDGGAGCSVQATGALIQHNSHAGIRVAGSNGRCYASNCVVLENGWSNLAGDPTNAQYYAENSGTLILSHCAIEDGTGIYNSLYGLSAVTAAKIYDYNTFNAVPPASMTLYHHDGTGQILAAAAPTLQP